MNEWEFIKYLTEETGCQLLLDVNYVVRTIEVEAQEYELLEHLMADVCLGEAIACVAEVTLPPDSLTDEHD